ncbi:MAG: glutathione S-transferase N-terminal domain-containing protein [Alphaproteobacteria bacterium]|nr:glutathione S-transferase N-terminal domain-containing protein [Alphaproteobacteria bacterium]MBU1512759.1 glutathione S-transferase N-terminal domain-containing protein [Alphaproteobacteria bacterium]MBU2096138.1 glutathione S-transferase N-terminal domain-containing protein [Alphaproteobacteria bacterium]MBU2152830.1 glutathione S-transferase N-terminal domain-containing protein [Alphaproteobacteria bacterium]MBU2307972.1 glutathione S-transferase N-terminal domain-containing protein [Alph
MIDLHYCATPNGQKVAIMLEETGLPFRVIGYDIFEGEHLAPEFGRINPNHKLPAIVDHEPEDGGEPLAVFESGAVLQYLAEKSGRFLAPSGRARSQAIQWLTWQMAGLGPMGGQASHFLRYAPAGQDYATERYTKELERLLQVLERRLGQTPYLAGEDYTIADMAVWPGRASAFVMGLGLEAYPAMSAWFERVRARPAVARVMARDDLKAPAKYTGRKQELSPDEWSNMFGDRMHGAVRQGRA